MLLNAKLNNTAQKMLWAEAVQTRERVRNSMATTGGTTGMLYVEKTKIIGLFLEFGRIGYVTKWENVTKQMTDKTFKATMMGYTDNNMWDT